MGRRFESCKVHHISVTIVNYTEEYPSLAEGTGLENRQGLNGPRGFESLFLRHFIIIAGWSSLVARRAHNPEAGGSNPPPAIFKSGPVV